MNISIFFAAFCDVHTPHDSDCKPKLEDISALGISTSKGKNQKSPRKGEIGSPVPVLFRGLIFFSSLFIVYPVVEFPVKTAMIYFH